MLCQVIELPNQNLLQIAIVASSKIYSKQSMILDKYEMSFGVDFRIRQWVDKFMKSRIKKYHSIFF